MSIVFAILLFSVLIFVHELGHFVAAKLSGVQVNEFAIFMGDRKSTRLNSSHAELSRMPSSA